MGSEKTENPEYCVVEVCCSSNSNVKRACIRSGIKYIGVTSNMERRSVQERVQELVGVQAKLGKWIHVHVSTPCRTGSPLRHFHNEGTQLSKESEAEWVTIMSNVTPYLVLGDSKSFELPRTNDIWKRELTLRALEDNGLIFECVVHLCQTMLRSKAGDKVGKQLRFVSSSFGFCESLRKRFGTCTCSIHASMNDVNWTKSALYTPCLARAILHAIKAGRRCP